MKRTYAVGIIRKNACIVFILFLFAMQPWAFATDDSRYDTIGGILRSSSLSKTDLTKVLDRAAAAINAGVPAEDVKIIIFRSIKRGADANTINRYLESGISTIQQGLPATPVLDRIEQGLSKGVPPERIAVAAQQLASKIVIAQPIVDDLIRGGVKPKLRNERETAIEAAARALEKAISEEELKVMSTAVRKRKGSLPIFISAANMATYLAGNGISPQKAMSLVQNAVENGYSEQDLDGIVKQIADQMREGTRAIDAATQIEREGMHGNSQMEPNMGDRGMGLGPSMEGVGGHKK